MKNLILILLTFICVSVNAQIIDTKKYTVYFNNETKNADIITYKLYKGGGDCDSYYRFEETNESSTDEDYYKMGFDKGHLVPAEDFAYDCDLKESTYFYYNTAPQYPNLNRGEWRSWEAIIRNSSHIDSLYIIVGTLYREKKMMNNVQIPTHFYKIVKTLSDNEIILTLLCKNMDSGDQCFVISYDKLKEEFNLPFEFIK